MYKWFLNFTYPPFELTAFDTTGKKYLHWKFYRVQIDIQSYLQTSCIFKTH